MNTEFGRKGWGNVHLKNTLPPGTGLQDGKYILLEVFGVGPFTICYLARQARLGKKVVINEFFLLDHCSRSQDCQVINQDINPNVYSNFKDKWSEEAIMLSKCSGNEHFVTVLDAFEENQTAYYVTEYINEADLQTFTLDQKEKFLDETRAIDFIFQISKGLTVLHENNIFHLNLSPVKVLVDKNNRAIIITIGIPRKEISSEILSDVTKLERAGYTSPELYIRNGDYGAYSDIYSVGAILYFLLTGKNPVSARERMSTPLVEPRTLNPLITTQTNAIVMKAMALTPEDRYPNLNGLLADLTATQHKQGKARTKKVLLYSAVALALIASISLFFLVKSKHNKPARQITEMLDHKRTNHLDRLSRLSLNEDKMRGMTLVKDAETKDSMVLGNYYALLIGIENYKDAHYQKLAEPVNDVNSMCEVLVSNYTFDKDHVLILTNPNKKDIFQSLNYFRDHLTGNDNLFVFYAGHGCYDDKARMGYILPCDAEYNNDAEWVSFQDIRKKFEIIAAKHILLIADACYAGSVFRGDDPNTEETLDEMTLEQWSKRSRTAFTSAYMKPVPDISVFLRQLISNLRNNRARLFLSEDLYINTRNSLIRSTSKKDPVKWGVIQDCGDEGGDFIFVRRTNGSK